MPAITNSNTTLGVFDGVGVDYDTFVLTANTVNALEGMRYCKWAHKSRKSASSSTDRTPSPGKTSKLSSSAKTFSPPNKLKATANSFVPSASGFQQRAWTPAYSVAAPLQQAGVRHASSPESSPHTSPVRRNTRMSRASRGSWSPQHQYLHQQQQVRGVRQPYTSGLYMAQHHATYAVQAH